MAEQTPVPFIANLPAHEIGDWLEALQTELGNLPLRPFAELNQTEREQARVAIVANPDPQTLLQLPKLQWVQSLWAGVEKLLQQLPDVSFEIVRLIDPQLSETMAEAALAWTLYLHRDMPRYRRQQSEKLWLQHDTPPASKRIVGVLGLGELGKTAAFRLTQNGFKVSGWSRSPKSLPGIETFCGNENLADLLNRADFVIVLLPLTGETHGLLDDARLSQMKPGAALINFGRGPIVDTAALLHHLNSGHLKHVVLDVFDIEPLPADSPLWSHPDITVLPHISAATNVKTASAIAAANIHRYFETGEIPGSVDRNRGY